jgi:hypothetical protein
MTPPDALAPGPRGGESALALSWFPRGECEQAIEHGRALPRTGWTLRAQTTATVSTGAHSSPSTDRRAQLIIVPLSSLAVARTIAERGPARRASRRTNRCSRNNLGNKLRATGRNADVGNPNDHLRQRVGHLRPAEEPTVMIAPPTGARRKVRNPTHGRPRSSRRRDRTASASRRAPPHAGSPDRRLPPASGRCSPGQPSRRRPGRD